MTRKKRERSRWWPQREVMIRLRDIRAATETVYGMPQDPCPWCDAPGLTTREGHPFAIPFEAVPLIAYDCGMCGGTGIWTPEATRCVERPKCRWPNHHATPPVRSAP